MTFQIGNTIAKDRGSNPWVEDHHRFRRALKKALGRAGPDAIGKIADKLVALAIEGVPWAIQEVANRLDGKPQQAVQLNTNGGTYVVMIPQTPDSGDNWEQLQRPGLVIDVKPETVSNPVHNTPCAQVSGTESPDSAAK